MFQDYFCQMFYDFKTFFKNCFSRSVRMLYRILLIILSSSENYLIKLTNYILLIEQWIIKMLKNISQMTLTYYID